MNKERNKNRLYLAFYDVKEQTEGDRYHIALVLIPKNPAPRGTDSWIFDVKTAFTINGPAWELRCAETRNRNFQLAALVLLAKLPNALNGERLAEILTSVPILQDTPDWKCTDWVWAAMQVGASLLISSGVLGIDSPKRLIDQKILNLMLEPEIIMDNGRRFVEGHVPIDLKKPVPTCDITGKDIKPEVQSLES
ncbi:hypothetical protein BU17DRAFT_79312 [Hysterangium stoloniferum]|nr:hypothetical protein BU17DRAFT_79312 [Hysterangium stoloniferum]